MNLQQNFTFAVLGGGDRGRLFAQWVVSRPDVGRVVAVAEPNTDRRAALAKLCGIDPAMEFASWDHLLARPKLADIAIITVMDRLHAPAATQALRLGYHLLLEKPMATTLADCRAIDAARQKSGKMVAVCHSMRYHQCTVESKRLLDSGAIGRLINFDLIDGVGFIHQAHSFVRGNWANEGRSSFMLLAKSCHDIDLISYLVDRPCRRVSSFGSLSYFRAENAPANAPQRCMDGCPVESTCPYSVFKVYLPDDAPAWYADHAGFRGQPMERKFEMLKTGPYGRCVFRCDNDVVDHQVVNFEFDDQIAGTFTMTAFDPGGRRLRLHGTEGTIEANFNAHSVDLFRTADKARQRFTLNPPTGDHAGGDAALIGGLVQAIRANDPNLLLTSTERSLESHTLVFAAERARRESRLVELAEL